MDFQLNVTFSIPKVMLYLYCIGYILINIGKLTQYIVYILNNALWAINF